MSVSTFVPAQPGVYAIVPTGRSMGGVLETRRHLVVAWQIEELSSFDARVTPIGNSGVIKKVTRFVDVDGVQIHG